MSKRSVFTPKVLSEVLQDKMWADIEAGNSFRGLFTALGELLNSFKEIIKDGLCWFPRLMQWQISKGEVSPVFEDNRNEGYYYRLKSYMDIRIRQEYPKELIQLEIKPENHTDK